MLQVGLYKFCCFISNYNLNEKCNRNVMQQFNLFANAICFPKIDCKYGRNSHLWFYIFSLRKFKLCQLSFLETLN